MSIKLQISGKLPYRWTRSRKKHEGLILLTSYKIKSIPRRLRGYRLHDISDYKRVKPARIFCAILSRRPIRTSVKSSVSKILFLLPSFSFVIPLNGNPLIVASYTFISLSLRHSACLNLRNYSALLACNVHITLFINRPTGSSRDKKRTKSLS